MAPVGGAEWWLHENERGDAIGSRCQRFSLEISDLRAEVTRLMSVLPRNDHAVDIMLEMLKKVHDLDRQIANWLNALPEEYQYTAVYWENGSPGTPIKNVPVFPGRVDAYHDLVAASMWNGIRASRIILGSILIRVAAWICSPADYRSTPEYTTAVRTMKANIADIISSIPFMLSTFTRGQQECQGLIAGSFLCGADEQAKMVGGLMCSWPLSTVRTCDFSTDEQREWAVGRLNSIAHDLGIKYASTLADVSCLATIDLFLLGSNRVLIANPLLFFFFCIIGKDPFSLYAYQSRWLDVGFRPFKGLQNDTAYSSHTREVKENQGQQARYNSSVASCLCGLCYNGPPVASRSARIALGPLGEAMCKFSTVHTSRARETKAMIRMHLRFTTLMYVAIALCCNIDPAFSRLGSILGYASGGFSFGILSDTTTDVG